MKNRQEKKQKGVLQWVYPSRRPKKKDFHIRASKGNREAIEARKKDFEHPRQKKNKKKRKQKGKNNARQWQKKWKWKNIKENEKSKKMKTKMNENERTWTKMKENERKWSAFQNVHYSLWNYRSRPGGSPFHSGEEQTFSECALFPRN